ncbi:hypothetical protein CerSpe_158740 [Prunus speciosa]
MKQTSFKTKVYTDRQDSGGSCYCQWLSSNEEVAVLEHSLAGAWSKTVNLAQLLNICTVNALGRVMVGKKLFADGSGSGDAKADEFKEMVVEVMVLAGVLNIGDFIPSLEWLDLQGVAAKMKKLHKRFDAFLTAIVEDHKKSSGGKHVDMLTTLLSLKEGADEVEMGMAHAHATAGPPGN